MQYYQTQLVALSDDMITNIRSMLRSLRKMEGVSRPHASDIIRKKNYRGSIYNTETKTDESLYQVSSNRAIPHLLCAMSVFTDQYQKQLRTDDFYDYCAMNLEYKHFFKKFIMHKEYRFNRFHSIVEIIHTECDVVTDYTSLQTLLYIFFKDGGVYKTIKKFPPTK